MANTFRIKKDNAACPVCGNQIECATGGLERPARGDFALCVCCAAVLVFAGSDEDLHYEKASAERLEQVKRENPKVILQLMLGRNAIINRLIQRN